MAASRFRVNSLTVRIPSALFVLITGALFSISALFSPNFSFVAIAGIMTVAGLLWFFQPSIASRLLTAPVAWSLWGLTNGVLRTRAHVDPLQLFWFGCVLILAGLIAFDFWNTQRLGLIPIALSFVLVLSAFTVERLFTNRYSVETRLMHWGVDGALPWDHDPSEERDASEVVLYRQVPGGYCLNTINNAELKAHLLKVGKPVVKVEYNMITSFGRTHPGIIRSVDGLMFSTENRMIRGGESNSGRAGNTARDACP